jgi:hypothetical protein
VEGRRTADRIVDLKWKNRLVSKHGTAVYRIEEWTIELADIPVQPHDPREFILEGRDLETGKPTPGFRDHIPKLEHKVTFYPSKATAELAEVFYEKSEVRTMKDLNGFGLTADRPYIRVYIFNPDDYK